jgi:isopentenyl diphosphate isomerase/L-lactate dehydrogenase-like FMN-dependent dehydrogenase
LIGAALLAAAALGAPGVGTDRPVVTSVERADARGVESRPVGTR